MNYLDFKEIMESENLTLPMFGQYTLQRAMRCQRLIKRLKPYDNETTKKQIKQLEEEKTYWIISAIEWAELKKDNPDLFGWGENILEKSTRRR